MGENNKQVRVDNWGIFFLSRLQAFFNKTDYCDLTLQFEGNVQLKVHRLVMNACTEYFQILEQTCEVIDDILLMPPDLQTDVILPIVNFMYTGMLEFPMSVFEKLYKTAELMNITVLLKILDAQKKPHQVPKSVVSKVPPTYNLQGKKITPKVEKQLPATLPGRKLPVWKRKSAPLPVTITPAASYIPEVRRTMLDPLASYDNTPKPTRFEWPEEDLKDFKDFTMLDTTFDNISYTSKPLVTQEDELRAGTSFDEIKHLPNASKKTKEYNNTNLDMDDIKSYVKEQKIRSNMAENEDDIDNDLDEHYVDEDYKPEGSPAKRKIVTQLTSISSKRVRFNINEKENNETKFNITQTGGKSEIDHSKIITEVLRKYPHLVKKNKNIRLKILAKNDVKVPPKTFAPKIRALVKKTVPAAESMKPQTSKPARVTKGDCKLPLSDDGPWYCDKCSVDSEQVEFVLYYLYRKHMTDVHNEKFDSRMCQYCGVRATKHNMLMYHQFTMHGIKPPAAYNFPKCNQCPYVALTEGLLIKHKLNHTTFDMQCKECKVGFNNETSLKHHIQITGHTGKTGCTNYDCQYCTKHYQTGANLFSHLKLAHREEAKRDGIVSIDDSDLEDDEEEITQDQIDNKVKILSNVQLPAQETTEVKTAPIGQHRSNEQMNNVPSAISTSLGLVDIVVLDDNNQQYILHPNQQQMVAQQALGNNQEFILPELNNPHTFVRNQVITAEQHNAITQSMLNNSDIGSTDELVMVLTDHDYNDGNNEILTNDNSNIVVLYSHPVEGQENQFITSQGNIMLNSETGMLEIRNTNTEHIVSQANTVESIEMIQREIDSHAQDVKTFPIVVTSSSTIVNNVEPLTQCTEILDHQSDHNKRAEYENQASLNEDETDSYAVKSQETIEKDQLEKHNEEYVIAQDQEEPMEVDEDCGVVINELPHPEEEIQNYIEAIEEIVEDTTIEKVHDEHAEKSDIVEVPDSPVNEEPQEIIEEHAQNVEYVPEPMEVDGRIKSQDDKDVIDGNETTYQESEYVNEEIHNTETEDNVVIQKEYVAEAAEADNMNETFVSQETVEESNVSQVPLEKSFIEDAQDDKIEDDGVCNISNEEVNIAQHVEENKNEVENEDCSKVVQETEETTNTDQNTENVQEIVNNIEPDQDLAHKETEEKQSNITEDVLHQEAADAEIEIHQGVHGGVEIRADSHTIQVNHDEGQQEMSTSIELQETKIAEVIEENQSVECPQQAEITSEETVEVNEEDKIDESVDPTSQNKFEGTSTDDLNTLETAAESVEKVVTEDETSQKSTENSNDKICLNPRTKISILDDWEDTDSQQSGKSGITVNKLINDWDDD